MSKRQRDVLRALRDRAQAEAVEIHQAAQARDAAARARLQGLMHQIARAERPPTQGAITRVDREARRRHHLADLRAAVASARDDLQAASAALAQATADLQQRVRAVQAVDVLDARAADAARRDQARRAETEADERNRPGADPRLDEDALQ